MSHWVTRAPTDRPPGPKQWPFLPAMHPPLPQYYSFILRPPNTTWQSICPHWSTKNTSPQSICPQSTKAYLQRSSRVCVTLPRRRKAAIMIYIESEVDNRGKCWLKLTTGKMLTRVVTSVGNKNTIFTHWYNAKNKDSSQKYMSCSSGFFPNEGGGGCCPIFWHIFISAFLVNKRSLFPPKCQ